ncbi:ATP-binding cassette domain-containing protein [Actinoplanes sp. NEAU-A12]|uniref:ATP-binding cassette domain-containing protein n=1 Tax=Actinoplanes sandaracinus TaxID=3045177 RepID=A0ABT6WN05_9ACTN|nr:ATP-binding cassette domain-containing protein [Actinoplanes sandaracinus]MDI6101080.1 ATP-binding cassette domain-containing protein [Actinoplanes sandaracinus]
MIEISGLRKTYRSRKRSVVAVDGVDLHVGEGEVFGVLGQSGAGKSTLLRCVNMLERPDAGTVAVGGLELTNLRRERLRVARHGIGMIHQHFALLSSRTVAGNVAFALEVTGAPRAERKARVAELLELVGLSERADAYPAQLSGGQKQRVGIARALAARPKVLLSDEATSALDPETTESILRLLLDLNRRLGLTILLITHEMTVVKRICTSAAVMRDGRFVESGTVAGLLRQPGSELARDLFPLDTSASVATAGGGVTIVDITVSGDEADEPIIADLARRFASDVRILSGSVETLAATRAGRWRLALPGAPEDNSEALEYLRKRGVTL